MADVKKPTGFDKKGKFQIKVDDATAQGVYSNFAMIYHSENEFVLDFCYSQPGPPSPACNSEIPGDPLAAPCQKVG